MQCTPPSSSPNGVPVYTDYQIVGAVCLAANLYLKCQTLQQNFIHYVHKTLDQ